MDEDTTAGPSRQDYQFVLNLTDVDLRKALGVPRFGFAVIACLAERGYDVHVAVNDHDSDLVKGLLSLSEEDLVRVHVVEAGCTDKLERERAVEILTHHFQSPCTALPSVLILYDFHPFTVPWKYADPRSLQDQIRKRVAASSAITTPFPYTYFNIDRYLGSGSHKSFLLPSPLLLNVSSLDAHVAIDSMQTDVEPSTTQLLFPAQLQEHKNHPVLLSAVRSLNKRRRTELTLTGSSYRDDVTANIKALVETFGLSEHVTFRGVVSDEDLIDLYRSSDVAVCPSLSEGGAYLALEALAVGCRVVVADIPPARDHLMSVGLEDSVTWFAPSDAADLALAISHALTLSPVRPTADLASWSDYAAELVKVADYVLGLGDRPHVCIDSIGRYQGLSLD